MYTRCFTFFLFFLSGILPLLYSVDTGDRERRLADARGKERLGLLIDLTKDYRYQDIDRSISYGEEAAALAEMLGDSSGKAEVLLHLGVSYLVKDRIEPAYKCLHQSLTTFKRLGDEGNVWKTHTAFIEMYVKYARFEDALQAAVEAFEISRRLGDAEKTADSLYILGIIQQDLEDFSGAAGHYRQAITTSPPDGKRLPYYINALGLCLEKSGGLKQAQREFQKALESFRTIGDEFGESAALINLGRLFAKTGEFSESSKYLKAARERIGGRDQHPFLGDLYYNTGFFFEKTGEPGKAVDFYLNALTYAPASNPRSLQDIHERLAAGYAAAGDFRNAWVHQKLFSESREKWANDRNRRQTTLLKVRYDNERKEQEIVLLKKDRRIQRLARNLLILVLFTVLLILVLILRKYICLFAFWKKEKNIGQYYLREKVGMGGMGTVYKASPVSDRNLIVAVKVLREELFDDPVSVERFRQEGNIVDSLEHPGILKVIERGIDGSRRYIVMEYIEGETLDAKIRRESLLAWPECLSIMSQLSEVVDLIHGRGIIHRDLKPSNIMITNDGHRFNRVKLLDFGLSRMKWESRLTQSGYVVGTVNYMPPEQITRFEYAAHSDIYALGMIFYELLTGSMAFNGDTSEMIPRILYQDLPLPGCLRSGIPGEIDRLISRMIAKIPQERPTAAEVVRTISGVSFATG